jgi:hypothetical protein
MVEQTFIVPPRGMVAPEHSPIAILERLAGFPLAARDQARSA